MTIRNCALSLLARREHTKFELQCKLIAKGFAEGEVTTILRDLELQNLQSDKRFVESYVAMRAARGFGPIRIKMELCERGVSEELIEQFLTDYKSTWCELAKATRLKKFGNKIPTDLHEKTKQMRYLYYKGFDTELIRKIINTR